MRALVVVAAVAALSGCSVAPLTADPLSDAPEARTAPPADRLAEVPSYAEVLRRWRGPDEVNGWIGANFRYDMARALLLSETQRRANGRLPILAPEAFFASPSGVCVDLSRFAVETLRAIDPALGPRYVMIEFDPVSIAGNTLRRHWLVSFQRDGQLWFFADSKRPGQIAGPYPSTQAFMAEYARYRGRQIVSFREAESYERKLRSVALKQRRDDGL